MPSFMNLRLVIGLTILILIGCNNSVTPQVVDNTPVVTPTASAISVITPIPTSTVTPTPTPVIYTVQANDTILSIAAKFNRSTSSIQAINGLANPRQLTVGQMLIIPPAETFDGVPTTTPTPPTLLVQSINFQQTTYGVLWCLGEVYNPGDKPISEVQVEAILFDERGILLNRATSFTELSVIPPAEAVPFAILFTEPPSDFDQYQLKVIAGIPMTNQSRSYFDFEIITSQGKFVGVSTYRVQGKLRNQGNHDAETVRLVAIAYDENEEVIAQRQVELAVNLFKAGAIAPFEIDLMIMHNTVSHYRILAQGLKIE